MGLHLVPGHRFEQNRPDTCAPTTIAERRTSPGCSPTTCTTPLRRFSGRSSALQLWFSGVLSDSTPIRNERIRTHLDCLLRQGFAVHPPLWLEDRFDYVSRFTICQNIEPSPQFDSTRLPADRNLHWVVLGVNKEAGSLEVLHDSHPGMEPFHALWYRQSLPTQRNIAKQTLNFSPALELRVPSSLRMLIKGSL